ncbi:MAG: hypothetical protein RI554_11500 [Trueperaceae bacterium]|nr:hypothetical protein [Trueperaceae bacterium]
MIRRLTLALSLWPSWAFLAGVAGAVPVGSVLAAFQIRRLRWVDVLFLPTYVALLVAHVDGAWDALEVAKLLVGPVIYLYVRRVRLDGLAPLLIGLVAFFFAEAVVGRIVSDDLRSATFLTLEPSHSARAYYTALFLWVVTTGRAGFALVAAFAFVAFNVSLSSVVFTAFLTAFVSVRRIGVVHVLRLLGASAVTVALLAAFVVTFPETRVANAWERVGDATELAQSERAYARVLFVAGGPRVAQSAAAFGTSTLWGHGLGYGVHLRTHSEGSPFDLTKVPYIMGLPSAGPASYLSQVAFEAGGVTLVALLAWLLTVRPHGWRAGLTWVFALVQLLVYSTTTMPTPWIFLALAERLHADTFAGPPHAISTSAVRAPSPARSTPTAS